MKKTMLLMLAFLFLMLNSCKENEEENDASFYTESADCSDVDVTTNTYATSVSPILNANCAFSGCHDTNTRKENVILDTYAGAKAAFLNGEALCAINHDCEKMPEGGNKLADAIITQLTCWVKEGCPQE